MPHVLLVVNPFASRVNERRLRKVEEALASAGSVETVLTERAGHATELAARDADALVVYGGDGVVNEALNGVGDVPFGALPGGGTSVFVRALGLPRDAVAAATAVAEAIVAGRTRRISLGRIEGRRFGFAAGVGFDAATVRRVDALGRTKDGRRPGDLAFAYELVRVFGGERFTLEPSMEIAGHGRAAAAMIANCDPYTYAGAVALHASPEASFELGLDFAAPFRITPASLPRLARYAVRGKGEPPGLLRAHDVDRIEITCDRPLPVQVDGEDLGDVEHVVIEAERDAIDVLC
jgi:diacylglycerol kinase family enzyme